MVWFFNDDERLAPEADLLVLMRNRQYLPRLGRFLQPDPNATGVAVQPSLAYGGSALPTPAPYVDLYSWAADGTSALAYVMSDPVNGADPTGLSSTISVSASARIMLWAAWAHLMPKPPARSPSPTGDFVQAGAAIGQIGGAMYAAWALGDDLGLRNRALWNIVEEKVVGAGLGIAGGMIGGKVGGRSGRPSGEWRGQGFGGIIGTGVGSLYNNGSTWVIARDIGVGLAQAGFGTVRGSAAGAYVGFAIGAGFYGGTIEYAADSAFDWWRY